MQIDNYNQSHIYFAHNPIRVKVTLANATRLDVLYNNKVVTQHYFMSGYTYVDFSTHIKREFNIQRQDQRNYDKQNYDNQHYKEISFTLKAYNLSTLIETQEIIFKSVNGYNQVDGIDYFGCSNNRQYNHVVNENDLFFKYVKAWKGLPFSIPTDGDCGSALVINSINPLDNSTIGNVNQTTFDITFNQSVSLTNDISKKITIYKDNIIYATYDYSQVLGLSNSNQTLTIDTIVLTPGSYYVNIDLGFVYSITNNEQFTGINDPSYWNVTVESQNVSGYVITNAFQEYYGDRYGTTITFTYNGSIGSTTGITLQFSEDNGNTWNELPFTGSNSFYTDFNLSLSSNPANVRFRIMQGTTVVSNEFAPIYPIVTLNGTDLNWIMSDGSDTIGKNFTVRRKQLSNNTITTFNVVGGSVNISLNLGGYTYNIWRTSGPQTVSSSPITV